MSLILTDARALDATAVRAAAMAAVALITDGMCIGLGSGRMASAFIIQLGSRVHEGLRISAVATSSASAALATTVGIPIVDLGAHVTLDLVVDGADEVDLNLDLVKGRGGALVRERIVAASARRQIILVDESKLVRGLGEHGGIPVEVIPLARWIVCDALVRAGITPSARSAGSGDGPFVTDNGNIIIDCALAAPLADGAAARSCERALLAITGVVDTGLFLGTASEVLIGHPDGSVETRYREPGRVAT